MSGLTAVAMSGGLDSSVVAWLLSQRGERVAGLSMLLWDRSGEARSGRCCGALDLRDAKRVARQCGIPHYTLSLEADFRRYVVDPFVGEYLSGRTPIPCTRCNTWIKFDLFVERARRIGAERIATGHYARIVDGPEGPELHRAVHRDKDQSYYLFELTQKQLQTARFPLGDKSKDEVRELARRAGLLVAEKGESMEICFVAGGIREFVESQVTARPARFGGALLGTPAEVVDQRGKSLGRAEPYYRYTVGQRRGLGIAAGERLYVLRIEPERNRVVVGGEDELLSPGLHGKRLHWISGPPTGPLEAVVKIRARHAGIRSLVTPRENGEVAVEFAEPQRGVTAGQAAVFYEDSRVLGGCWIAGPGPE